MKTIIQGIAILSKCFISSNDQKLSRKVLIYMTLLMTGGWQSINGILQENKHKSRAHSRNINDGDNWK